MLVCGHSNAASSYCSVTSEVTAAYEETKERDQRKVAEKKGRREREEECVNERQERVKGGGQKEGEDM